VLGSKLSQLYYWSVCVVGLLRCQILLPLGVSGPVPQWAVEMESKQCFDFGIQKKVDQLHITPTPVASLVGGLSSPSSVASDVSPVNADPTVCYNPNCNGPVDLSVEACCACNYPSASFDFYCFCGRRCNPLKNTVPANFPCFITRRKMHSFPCCNLSRISLDLFSLSLLLTEALLSEKRFSSAMMI
jgi:hypothetical protein